MDTFGRVIEKFNHFSRMLPYAVPMDDKTYRLDPRAMKSLSNIGWMNLDKLLRDGKVSISD